MIRWRVIEPTVASSDSAETKEGWLAAATTNRVVVAAGPDGDLVSYDAEGPHELVLRAGADVRRPGRDRRRRDRGARPRTSLVFFDPDGRQTEEADGGERLGALAPDGHVYAQANGSRRGVQLVDPASADATPVEGPSGPISDLGWAPDGDLLVVVDADGSRTLWRCSPEGTGCAAEVDDPTGTLRLG